jgi:hypothetical protein
MTKGWKGSRRQARPRPPGTVSSRADWRDLLNLARKCAADAREEVNDPDAELRLMTLRRKASGAATAMLDRDAGATVADTGRAFLSLCGALARPTTPGVTRVALAPAVDATAAFLDDQLHELAAAEFQRAHVGRPGGME